MDLSVVIVNWKSADYVRQCLQSLWRVPPRCSFEVIVIDNASFDSCGPMLAREFPSVIFLQNTHNSGFARANNLAAAKARGRALLFLNPDTEVHPGALDHLLSVLDSHPDAGVVGARLLNTDGSLQRTSIQAFPTLLNQFLDSNFLRRRLPQLPLWRAAALEESEGVHAGVEAVSGACLLTTRQVFDRIGGFNESYFMYSEDTDYCFMSRNLGFENYFAPEAVVVHHGGKSSGGAYSKFSAVMQSESIWRFFRERRKSGYALIYRLALLLKSVLRLTALTLIMPLAWLTFRAGRVTHGLCKWRDILRWTLECEQEWIKSYESNRDTVHSKTNTKKDRI
jgi:N-acetylglucosaminyl-diphospho-decaprenol L-rhamnosyltransferase